MKSVTAGAAGLALKFVPRPGEHEVEVSGYDNVIFAVPKRPLQQILLQSLSLFNKDSNPAEGDVIAWLDTAFDFPLVKVFGIVHRRWWEEDFRPNFGATQMPTRELHYWKGATDGSRQGMVMVYTDRPSSALWSNFVASGPHEDVWKSPKHPSADGASPPNQFSQRQRLRGALADYLRSAGAPDVGPEDLEWVGIRDWGRDPYGGNHAWRPKRKYWYVMRQMADLAENRRIHVCGEAYSDYHGFIEGPLRSAVLALSAALSTGPEPRALEWPRAAGTLLAYLNIAADTKNKREADRSGRVERAAANCLTKELSWWVRSVATVETAKFYDETTGDSYLYGVKRYDQGSSGIEQPLSMLDECDSCEDRQAALVAFTSWREKSRETLAPATGIGTVDKWSDWYNQLNATKREAWDAFAKSPESSVIFKLVAFDEANQAGPELVERVFRDARLTKHTRARLATWRKLLALRKEDQTRPVGRPEAPGSPASRGRPRSPRGLAHSHRRSQPR